MPQPYVLRGFLLIALLLATPEPLRALSGGGQPQPSVPSRHERLTFERLSVEEGLSQVTVETILQDRQGFMWFGTQDGLNRYDGYDVRVYRPEPGNPRSLNGSFVTALYEDADGTLWVGTERGLNRMDRWGGTFTRYTHDAGDPGSLSGAHVTALAEGPGGKLWVGTRRHGLNRLDDPASGIFTRFQHDPERSQSLADNAIRELHRGANGQLWVGTVDGLDRLQPASGTFVHVLSDSSVSALHEAPGGRLWVGVSDKDRAGGGLLRYDVETGQTRLYRPGGLEAPAYITAISAGDAPRARRSGQAGMIWVGIYGEGLRLFDPKTETFTRYVHDPDDPKSLGGDWVTAVLEGRFGRLWVGTARRGVSGADRHASTFAHYHHEPGNANSLSDDVVFAIYEDADSILWVGTMGGGLNRFDRAAGTVERYRHDPGRAGSVSSDRILDITEDAAGRLWIGTVGGGLDRLDRTTGTFTNYPLGKDGTGRNVGVVQKAPGGTFWVGTNEGLVHFDPERGTVLRTYRHDSGVPTSLSGDHIVEVSAAPRGRLWIGTARHGLDLFDPEEGRVVRHFRHDPQDPNSLGSDYVAAVHTDRKGRVWVATYGGGLALLNPDGQGFTRYTEQNSALPSNALAGLLEDEAGTLWISTYEGIVQFDPDRETFRTYGPDRGVQSTEFNLTAYHQGPDGEMFFGGVNGLNAFFPEDVEVNMHPPALVLTDAVIRMRPTGRDSMLRPHVPPPVRLRYNQNDLSLGYVGLHYAAPQRNAYAYRLVGYDAEWQEVGPRRQAIYTNLDPGEYTFRVRAANRDGVWSKEKALLSFAIRPPWWRTWWAYGGYALALVLGGVAIDRFQRRRLVQREREKAMLREAELKAEIAQRESARKTQEMEEARQLQLSMLPHETPTLPQVEVAAYMQTATEVGGDYYDFHCHRDGTLLFAVGDATGHGLRAGTMVTAAKTLFNSLLDGPTDLAARQGGLARILQRASGVLRRLGMRRLYMALALGRLDGHRLELAGAGLPPALVYRAAQEVVEEVPLNGMPLGGLEGFPYQQRTLSLAPGDVVVLMSDGFPEAFNAERRMLGYDRAATVLREVATASPEAIIARYEKTAQEWIGAHPLSDDMTFIVLKMRSV